MLSVDENTLSLISTVYHNPVYHLCPDSSCNVSELKKCNGAYTYTKWCQPLCIEHQSQSAFCTLFQVLKCPKSWWVTCTVTMAVFFGKLQVFNSGRKGSRPSQPVAHIDSKSARGSRLFNSTTKAKIYTIGDRHHLLIHASFFLPILPTCPTQYQPRYCAIQDGFGGLVVSILATGTRPKPLDFSGIQKILSMPSFGGEVK
jgi:hypothetical protein